MSGEDTKGKIASALKNLMTQKPLSKITVKDITDEVGISRHTFYYHFHDIYALVVWILKTECAGVIGRNREISNWYQGYESVCRYALTNKAFVIGVYRSEEKQFFSAFVRSTVKGMVKDIMKKQDNIDSISERQKDIISSFYSDALTDAFLGWIDRNMEDDYEAMTETFRAILSGELGEVITKLSK